MKVIWTAFATNELKSIYNYYKINATKIVATEIKQAIFKATKQLSKYPESGQIEENLVSLNEGHRCIVTNNYKAIYKLSNSNVYIIDVFDCRRNPKKLIENIKKA